MVAAQRTKSANYQRLQALRLIRHGQHGGRVCYRCGRTAGLPHQMSRRGMFLPCPAAHDTGNLRLPDYRGTALLPVLHTGELIRLLFPPVSIQRIDLHIHHLGYGHRSYRSAFPIQETFIHRIQ